jgi:hypothetical protein
MDWPGHPSPERAVLKAIVDAVRTSGGRWPVYQHLDLVLHDNGVRPDKYLKGMSNDLVRFDAPLESPSRIIAPVPGFVAAYPDAREIHHGFLKALRKLFDRWEREELLSPAEAQPVVVHAHELWAPGSIDRSELRVVGLLLETEGIGKVAWTEDPDSPWSIEIDFDIRRWGGVGDLSDYLRIRSADDDFDGGSLD